jgi:hypothetical protein
MRPARFLREPIGIPSTREDVRHCGGLTPCQLPLHAHRRIARKPPVIGCGRDMRAVTGRCRGLQRGCRHWPWVACRDRRLSAQPRRTSPVEKPLRSDHPHSTPNESSSCKDSGAHSQQCIRLRPRISPICESQAEGLTGQACIGPTGSGAAAWTSGSSPAVERTTWGASPSVAPPTYARPIPLERWHRSLSQEWK